MLERILIAILEGTFEQIKLATELNITQEELKAALEQLYVTGYLDNENVSAGCCRKNCIGCASKQDCQSLLIYRLTEKGKKIASALVK